MVVADGGWSCDIQNSNPGRLWKAYLMRIMRLMKMIEDAPPVEFMSYTESALEFYCSVPSCATSWKFTRYWMLLEFLRSRS